MTWLPVLCYSEAQISHTLRGSCRTSVQWVKSYPTVPDSLRDPHGPVTKPNRLTFFRVTGVSENSHGYLPAPQEFEVTSQFLISPGTRQWLTVRDTWQWHDNQRPKESTQSSRARNEVSGSAGLRENFMEESALPHGGKGLGCNFRVENRPRLAQDPGLDPQPCRNSDPKG